MTDANTTETATQTASAPADPLQEARERITAMRRQTFVPATLQDEDVIKRLGTIMGDINALGLPVVNNYDPNAPIPADMLLACIPIPRNMGRGTAREVVGMAIGLIPSMDATRACDGGEKFITDAITDRHLNKLANASRKVIVEGKSTSVPATTLDYITNQRTADSLDGFNKTFGKVLPTMQKTLRGLTKNKLRDCLAISAYAEQQYANVPQFKWVGVIHALLGECARLGIEPGVMASWENTRDAAAGDTGDFDLEGLEAALGAPTSEGETDA